MHPEFCLTRRDVVFFRGTTRLAWKDRRRADKVEVTFRAGKSDQNRLGSVVPRNRVSAADGVEGDVRSKGALEILLDLLDLYPTLDGAGDWETMAVKAEVWVEAVTKGGRRFMAAWRQEEEDAARHCQEKREATRLGKLQSHTEA